MLFHFIPQLGTPPAHMELARELADTFRDRHFDHPKHLQDVLREHGAQVGKELRSSLVNGTICTQYGGNIILRITPMC